MRLFLGLPLAEYARRALFDQTERLREERPRYRWIPQDNYHITLVFLGDIGETDKNDLVSAVAGLDSTPKPFTVELSKIGQFPLKGRPRVVYADIDKGVGGCCEIYRIVSGITSRFVPPDSRQYHPHVTLARVKPGQTSLPSFTADVQLSGGCQVDRIVLFESRLSQKGARYFPVSEFSL